MPSARPAVRRPALAPGVRVLRRDADTVQVGLDPSHATVLRRRPEVRDTLAALTRADPRAPLDPEVVDRLHDRGLLAGPDLTPSVRMHDACTPALAELVARAGVRVAARAEVTLLAVESEPDRELLDPLVRDGRTHLLARISDGAVSVGPFVVPARTACVRCLDRHRADHDPRWPLLVAQQASPDPASAGSAPASAAQRMLLAGWVAADLRTHAEGRRPSTWGTVLRLPTDLRGAEAAHWTPHPACGCAWDGPPVRTPLGLAGSATMAT